MKTSQRRILTTLIFAALVGFLGWKLLVWATTPRQTAVRANETAKLQQISICIGMYLADNNSLPNPLSVLKKEHQGWAGAIDELDQRVTSEGNLLVYRREVFREIKKGEPAGNEGDPAEEDIPPARAYMILDGSQVCLKRGELQILEGPIRITEADFQSKFSTILNPQQEGSAGAGQ